MKRSIWSIIALSFATAKESALFQHSYSTLKFVYDIDSALCIELSCLFHKNLNRNIVVVVLTFQFVQFNFRKHCLSFEAKITFQTRDITLLMGLVSA